MQSAKVTVVGFVGMAQFRQLSIVVVLMFLGVEAILDFIEWGTGGGINYRRCCSLGSRSVARLARAKSRTRHAWCSCLGTYLCTECTYVRPSCAGGPTLGLRAREEVVSSSLEVETLTASVCFRFCIFFCSFAFSSSFFCRGADSAGYSHTCVPGARPLPSHLQQVLVCPRAHPELNHPTKGRG